MSTLRDDVVERLTAFENSGLEASVAYVQARRMIYL